jgi:hypothetical protein
MRKAREDGKPMLASKNYRVELWKVEKGRRLWL